RPGGSAPCCEAEHAPHSLQAAALVVHRPAATRDHQSQPVRERARPNYVPPRPPAMTRDLDEQLARLAKLTDGWIQEAVAQHISPHAERLAAMLDYHLGWRGPDLQRLTTHAPAGKKLRPALVLLVSEAVSG